MKKLFLITASLTPFVSLALNDVALDIDSEVANAIRECNRVAALENARIIYTSVTQEECVQRTIEMWNELQACKKAAKGQAVEAELPTLEIIKPQEN